MRIKRRNVIWLAILGALAGTAIISQGLDSSTSIFLMGALGIAGGVALFDLEPQAIIKTLQEKTALGGKVSADAREATERARARGSYMMRDVQLLDMGLIALRDNYEGMVMQRTRSLSLDDNGARPYVSLQIPALEADRRSMVRFEIEDGHGTKVYIHEQEMYLRDGKMDILSSNQMPLFNSTQNLAPGDGDLRVYIDGDLVGVLGFSLAPSTRDRWAGRRQNAQESAERLADHDGSADIDDEIPMSLEELLRQQQSNKKS